MSRSSKAKLALTQYQELEKRVSELEARLKPKALRQKRTILVGGPHADEETWVDDPPETIRIPKFDLWSWDYKEVYRLVGESPVGSGRYLYDYAGTLHRDVP